MGHKRVPKRGPGRGPERGPERGSFWEFLMINIFIYLIDLYIII